MENFNGLFSAKTVENKVEEGLIFSDDFIFDNYEYFVITSENMKTLFNSFTKKKREITKE